MRVDVTADAEIQASSESVARYASDPLNDPEWIGGIEEARWLTEPPLRVGSRVERIARFMGRRIEYVLEVTELDRGRRVAMRSVRAPFPIEVTYAFKDAGEGRCRASIQIGGEAGGAYRLAGPLLGPMVRRSISRDLRNLKRLSEGAPSSD
jgi:hypothetical protein